MNGHITVRVPGKVMLAGEYSVLRGGAALSAALATHLQVTAVWEPGAAHITIDSDLWSAPREFDPARPPSAPGPAGAAAMAAYRLAQSRFELRDRGHLRLRIKSGWPVAYGLGSSSAVRLGILLAVRGFDDPTPAPSDDWDTARQSFELQRSAQGYASGYDTITQLRGGIINLHADQAANSAAANRSQGWPGAYDQLAPSQCPRLKFLHHAAGPRGSDTAQLVPKVVQALDQDQGWAPLIAANERWQQELLRHQDETDSSWRQWLKACADQRQMMASLPGFPHDLAAALAGIPGCDQEWSWKTTGAGGEDSLVFVLPNGWTPALKDGLAKLSFQPWQYGWDNVGVVRHRDEEK